MYKKIKKGIMVIFMNIKGIFFGTLLAAALAFGAVLISAALVYFNMLSGKSASVAVFISVALGMFIGTYVISKNTEHKKLPNALCSAVLFTLIILIISACLNDGFTLHTRTAALIAAVFGSSVLGTIVGKN